MDDNFALTLNNVQISVRKGDYGVDPIFQKHQIVGLATLKSESITYLCQIIQMNDNAGYAIRTTDILTLNIPPLEEMKIMQRTIESLSKLFNEQNALAKKLK